MLNMDFSQRVIIHTQDMAWQPSPMPGVWRKPLAREAVEQGHATSIVKYDPGSEFHEHDHPGGEEILVLSGTFSDETGDYHAGTYFRNPPGFRHAPFSRDGCALLVKLHQFRPNDTAHVCIDTNVGEWADSKDGIQRFWLHKHDDELALMVKFAKGTLVPHHVHKSGEELFVLSGELEDEYDRYTDGTWLRSPKGSAHELLARKETLAWLKTGIIPR